MPIAREINDLINIIDKRKHGGKKNSMRYLSGILIFMGLCGIAFLLKSRAFFQTDFQDWNKQKCNPEYLFYSGYIKTNPNSSPFESTKDNFNDCIIQYGKEMDDNVDRRMESIVDKNTKSMGKVLKEQNENRETVLEMRRTGRSVRTQSIANEVNRMDKTHNTQIENIKIQMLLLNKAAQELKEYLHSALTYAMMNFSVKYETQISYDGSNKFDCNTFEDKTSCNEEKTCTYNVDTCMSKAEFFKEQVDIVYKMNESYFDGNKL